MPVRKVKQLWLSMWGLREKMKSNKSWVCSPWDWSFPPASEKIKVSLRGVLIFCIWVSKWKKDDYACWYNAVTKRNMKTISYLLKNTHKRISVQGSHSFLLCIRLLEHQAYCSWKLPFCLLCGLSRGKRKILLTTTICTLNAGYIFKGITIFYYYISQGFLHESLFSMKGGKNSVDIALLYTENHRTLI